MTLSITNSLSLYIHKSNRPLHSGASNGDMIVPLIESLAFVADPQSFVWLLLVAWAVCLVLWLVVYRLTIPMRLRRAAQQQMEGQALEDEDEKESFHSVVLLLLVLAIMRRARSRGVRWTTGMPLLSISVGC